MPIGSVGLQIVDLGEDPSQPSDVHRLFPKFSRPHEQGKVGEDLLGSPQRKGRDKYRAFAGQNPVNSLGQTLQFLISTEIGGQLTSSPSGFHHQHIGSYPLEIRAAEEGLVVKTDIAASNGVVHLIDLSAKKVVKNIKVGKRPRRFVLAAGGAELWVTNELDATVSVVDTKTNETKATVKFAVQGMREADITPVGMTLSADGKTMWVGLGKANHVMEVDVASKKTGRQVLVGKRAWGLTLHPDGKTLFVTNGLSDDMTLVDTASAKAVKTVAVGRVPHSIVIKP